ncbi:DUF2637 domain-containing protein [Streptomyces sp. AJS327]|nr:DUF2637 domain-containing protein [Streptomyces sp. AJS327]
MSATTSPSDTWSKQTAVCPSDVVPEARPVRNTRDDDREGLEAALARLLDTPERFVQPRSDCPHVLGRHRKRRNRQAEQGDREGSSLTWQGVLSLTSVVLTALIMVLVSVLGAIVSYEPLRRLAADTGPPVMAELWPLLIYAPWVAATLSVLRNHADRRRAKHSWLVVVFFAVVAMVLCVISAPHTPAGITVAGLPPITVLLCFHQLVCQLDLAHTVSRSPRHAGTPRANRRVHP